MSEVSAPIVSPSLDIPDGRELGSDAVFTLSSAKPGNGVEQLRDFNLDTYWLVILILTCLEHYLICFYLKGNPMELLLM